MTRYEFDQTSPPVVFEDLVIVGSRVPDRVQRRFDPPGTVQAFDARTGERRWVFFTIPQSSDDFGADTWEDESWRYTGHANVWGLMSLDAERGLLYVPTSTPSSDYFGGRRVGANLFAESLVCLDAPWRRIDSRRRAMALDTRGSSIACRAPPFDLSQINSRGARSLIGLSAHLTESRSEVAEGR